MAGKSWIVYQPPEWDTEIKVIEDDHNGLTDKLEAAGNIILGHPYFIRKIDAKNYIEMYVDY